MVCCNSFCIIFVLKAMLKINIKMKYKDEV